MKLFLILSLLTITLFANIGSVAMLKGSATVSRNSEVLEIKTGFDINEGDTINVGKKSRLQVMLNDETIITLGQNTEYSFDAYNDKEDPHMKMSIRRGFMRAITGKIGKMAPKRFKVKTASATIGIRGTGWETFIGLNVENSVCFAGAITITTPTKTFDIPAGNMLLITDGQAKKYKANMKFFNSQIKKIETKIKEKAKEKESENEEETQNTPQLENSVDNAPPEIEIEFEQDNENILAKEIAKDETVAEEDYSQIIQDVNTEVVNDTIENTEFGDITITGSQGEIIPDKTGDPTSGF